MLRQTLAGFSLEPGWQARIAVDDRLWAQIVLALSDLLPELQFHEHDRVPLSAALLAGFGLMAAAGWWE